MISQGLSQALSQGISRISGSIWYHDLLINYMVTEDIIRSVWSMDHTVWTLSHQMKSFKDVINCCRSYSQRLVLQSVQRTNSWWYNSEGILFRGLLI